MKKGIYEKPFIEAMQLPDDIVTFSNFTVTTPGGSTVGGGSVEYPGKDSDLWNPDNWGDD